MRGRSQGRRSIGLVLAFAAAFILNACGGSAGPALQLGEERVGEDEAQLAARLVEAIKATSENRHPTGLVRRFNQAKGLGCFDAEFKVDTGLPEAVRQGLFAMPGRYQAKVRFASASKMDDREKDFRGLSIRVLGVAGAALYGEPGAQDFILNSHPALFAADPQDFLSFVEASRDDKLWKYFLNPGHWYSLRVVLKGRDKISSPFDIGYWSTTPYRLGTDPAVAVKYSATPCSSISSDTPDDAGVDFLTENMRRHLNAAPVCFSFMVQFQTDPKAMPLEDASVAWDAEESPFIKVATLTIGQQAFQTDARVAECEAMSFNPWQSLAAHRPLGAINRVRQAVYHEMARYRADENRRRQADRG